jgi:hypothetical protein
MAFSRNVKTQIGIGIAFFILGIGNLFFGHHKAAEYAELMEAAKREMVFPGQFGLEKHTKENFPLMNPSLSLDKQSRNLAQLRGRFEFYSVVFEGSKYFVLISIAFFLTGAVFHSKSKRQDASKNF